MSLPDEEEDESETTRAIALGELRSAIAEARRMTASLTAIAGPAAGKVFKLLAGENVFGRAPEVTFQVEDEGVSRKHVKVVEQDGQWVLIDLGSRNGTIHNGKRITAPMLLRDGDRIRVGAATVLKFGFQDEYEQRLQEKLYDSATRDALTGAFNRRYFDEQLASEWAWAQRHRQPLAVIAIDADHFKRVNDTLGHAAGDTVLREIVATAHGVLRKEDLLARVGGEEFVVLARSTSIAQAYVLAERLRMAIEARVIVANGARVPVTVSLGLATTSDPVVTAPNELLELADRNLYRAKQLGRNRVEPFAH